jgi:hypothetical protein
LAEHHLDAGQEDEDSGIEAQDAYSEREQSQPVEPPPSPIFPIHPERWFDGSKSTSRAFELPGLACIRDAGGCPYKPAQIPPCPANQPAASPRTFSELDALVGSETVLRGRVVMTLAQLSDCEPHCCARGRPALSLRVPLIDTPQGSSTITLSDDRFPDAFKCAADEFTWCCGIRVDVPVLAHGVLARRDPQEPGYDTQVYGYRMPNPRMCEERSPTP